MQNQTLCQHQYSTIQYNSNDNSNKIVEKHMQQPSQIYKDFANSPRPRPHQHLGSQPSQAKWQPSITPHPLDHSGSCCRTPACYSKVGQEILWLGSQVGLPSSNRDLQILQWRLDQQTTPASGSLHFTYPQIYIFHIYSWIQLLHQQHSDLVT